MVTKLSKAISDCTLILERRRAQQLYADEVEAHPAFPSLRYNPHITTIGYDYFGNPRVMTAMAGSLQARIFPVLDALPDGVRLEWWPHMSAFVNDEDLKTTGAAGVL